MKALFSFFVLSCVLCETAWAAQLNVGPVYIGGPGELDVLIEGFSEDTPHASNFELLLNHQPVASAIEVKPFDGSGKALSLVLCIDVGGSEGDKGLSEIKAALLYLIGRAADRPEDRIALVTFAEDIKIAASFDRSREQLVDAVLHLQTRGTKARLYQALDKSLDLFNRQNLPKRRRLIVISEGKDEGSLETPASVTAKAKALGGAIDAIGYGKIDRASQQGLNGIVGAAGGQFIEANPDQVSTRDAIGKLYQDILGTFSLVVSFKYEAELTSGETEDASMAVTRPGKSPLNFQIPGKFRLPRHPAGTMPGNKIALTPDQREPQFSIPQNKSWMDRNGISKGIVASAAVLVFAVALFFLLRPKKANNSGRSEIPATQCKEPERETARSQVSTRITLVGGYFFPPPAQNNPTAELIGSDGPLANTWHAINKEIFSIGSAEESDLCISNDDCVSRHHAYLRYERGSLFIFDNSSISGTFVNQERISGMGAALEPGDQIKIGSSSLSVRKRDGNRE